MFLDDIRSLLAAMKSQFDSAGDFDIVFAPYNPTRYSKGSELEPFLFECSPGIFVSHPEYLYSNAVNRCAGKLVKLSTMIRELEYIIQSPFFNDEIGAIDRSTMLC